MSDNLDAMMMSGRGCTQVDSRYLMILLDTLAPYLTYYACPVGKRFSFSAANQPDCIIIRKGSVSLYRQPDDILVELIEAPMIRGVIPVHELSSSVYIMRVIDAAEIATIDKALFYSLLTKHNLWEPYAMHLQLVTSTAAEVLFKLVSPTVFEQVRYQLYELMSKPQALRASITAENYIRDKTHLSRSAIMNTLSTLKKGGYISIENGHLTDIKRIPAHF
jgi:hypothetical protein